MLKNIKLKNIYLCARNSSKFKKWNKTKNSKIISWKDRNKSYSTLLINATPIGMNNNSIPVSKNRIKYLVDNSLMLVTALSPKIGYDNAAKIAKNALKNKTTLKVEAMKSGLINEKDYNKIVDPNKMIKPD